MSVNWKKLNLHLTHAQAVPSWSLTRRRPHSLHEQLLVSLWRWLPALSLALGGATLRSQSRHTQLINIMFQVEQGNQQVRDLGAYSGTSSMNRILVAS